MLMESTQTNDPFLKAITAGHTALLLTGNIHDFILINEEIVYRPQLIAEQLHQRGYCVLRYSKSQGGRIHNYSGQNPKEKETVDSRLNAVGLKNLLNRECQNSPEEIRNFFRAASRLLQVASGVGMKPFAVIIDYTEHLAPAVQTSAAAAEEHTFVAESLHMLANAPALRKTKNLLLCITRDGFQNSLLNDLQKVEFPFPDEAQTLAFIQLALKRNKTKKQEYADLEAGFKEDEFARLTRGLRVREIEAMLREARAEQTPLRRSLVLEAKARAILRASEDTLSVISTSLTLDDVVGLQAAKRFFRVMAQKLKAGDPSSPRAVLMVGPPGTSKSTFAPILANMCGFNILQFRNVKNMYVGESERRLNLALTLVENLAPSILFIDEITETTPSRNSGVNDGGVSQDLLGQLFKFSARDDLRGRVLLLGASNVPERLDPAWHDRFIFIPFLELLPDEMCELFTIFERRILGQAGLDSHDPKLVKASQILHQKGASPRKVMDVVNHALLFAANDRLTPDAILSAAHDYVGSANPMAVAYTSLIAISLASFQSYLPWSLDPEHYVYPAYLEGIVDKKTGVLDRKELQKRIHEYRKFTNL
ncbi:MAG: ATP-dependent zinc metalloprotease FtsH [bacterium]|nr:ATP-dependent zinc metalloprotease FtsH [bacterium]